MFDYTFPLPGILLIRLQRRPRTVVVPDFNRVLYSSTLLLNHRHSGTMFLIVPVHSVLLTPG